MDKDYSQKTTSIAIIAIVAAVALLGVVVITVAVTIPLQQQAEAAGRGFSGCQSNTVAFNASKGNCFHAFPTDFTG
jgi:hypothetical protein